MNNCFLLLMVLLVAGCGQQPAGNQEADKPVNGDTGKMEIMVPKTTCYASRSGRDTIRMKVEKFPNTVMGTLIYSLYEKDGNRGNIEGTMSGDTLIADYTFMSEGKESVRQVIFLLKGDSAIEGFGPVNDENGRMVFKDRSQINFSGPVLRQIDCATNSQ